MKLDTKERIVLLGILPKEGDFTTLKIIRKLQEDLSFTEDEHKELKFNTLENGSITWQPIGDKLRDFEIGEKATDIIVAALKKLNTDKKLTGDHITIYERFVGE